MPFQPPRVSHLFPLPLAQALLSGLLVGSLASFVPAPAHAVESCSDLFLSDYKGLLENPAARAAMIFKLKQLIPRGSYVVNVDGLVSRILTVTYNERAEFEMTLDGELISSNRVWGETKDRSGFISKSTARVQVLSDNRLSISTTIHSGNYETAAGLVRRDLRLEVTLDRVSETDARTIRLSTYEGLEVSSIDHPFEFSHESHTVDVHIPATPRPFGPHD